MSSIDNQISNDKISLNKLSLGDLLLVKGTFTPVEAKEVLMSLIKSKISFHMKKNMRSYEHNGEEDRDSKQRIEELERMRKQLLLIFKNADKDGLSVKMESQIDIEFLDTPE